MRDVSGIGPVQCVVTGHGKDGQATVLSDGLLESRAAPPSRNYALPVWGTAQVPACLDADAEGDLEGPAFAAGFGFAGGCLIRIIDMMPGQQSLMHATASIDFAIVLNGEIEMETADGSRSSIGQGGVIVQRATSHLWRNTTSEPCRICIVMVAARCESEAVA